MKKLALLFCSIYFSIAVSGQKIHFTDTANVWNELELQYNDGNPPIFNYSIYSHLGDTLVASHVYRRFGFRPNNICYGCKSLVREDTILKKIYIRDTAGDSDIVLMDYNLHVGDSFRAPYYHFVVSQVDSTLINSVWHKVWTFLPIEAGIYGSESIQFIEGIGCIQHPTYMLWNFSGCVECMQPFMYCFSNAGATPSLHPPVSFLDNDTSCTYYATLSVSELNQENKSFLICPSPAGTYLNISASEVISSIVIANILGQTECRSSFNSSKVQVNIRDLPSGVYLIKINNAGIRRFVKE